MAKSQKMFISMSSISPIPNDDLSNWEFVNQSDCNYDVISGDDAVFDVQSFDLDESIHSLSDDSSSDHDDDVVDDVVVDVVDDAVDDVVDDVEQVEEKKDSSFYKNLEKNGFDFTVFDDLNLDLNLLTGIYPKYEVEEKKESPIIEDMEKIAVNFTKFDDFNVNLTNSAANYRNYDVERYDEDDEEDDDGDDMDDDLVPWEVKGLYMRERIKKSEKKSLTKMIKSKKPLIRSVRGRFGQYHAVKAY